MCVCGGGSIMLTAANEGKQVGGSIEMTGERGLAGWQKRPTSPTPLLIASTAWCVLHHRSSLSLSARPLSLTQSVVEQAQAVATFCGSIEIAI